MILFVAVASVLFALPARAVDWMRYCNARFGPCADIPKSFHAGPEPENGDGLVFTDAAGAEISVYGSWNLPEQGPTFERQSWLETIGAPAYKADGPDWFVLSGLKGGTIYYVKVAWTHETIATLAIKYPAALKSAYDGIAAHSAKSFTHGN
jgi:hypothetical protein